MTEYAVELQTIHGMADSAYVDRLAALVYELDEVIDPLIALNDDGSLEISFCVTGENAREASTRGLDAVNNALLEAAPLRAPTEQEAAHGAEIFEAFAVRRSSDREAVLA